MEPASSRDLMIRLQVYADDHVRDPVEYAPANRSGNLT